MSRNEYVPTPVADVLERLSKSGVNSQLPAPGLIENGRTYVSSAEIRLVQAKYGVLIRMGYFADGYVAYATDSKGRSCNFFEGHGDKRWHYINSKKELRRKELQQKWELRKGMKGRGGSKRERLRRWKEVK